MCIIIMIIIIKIIAGMTVYRHVYDYVPRHAVGMCRAPLESSRRGQAHARALDMPSAMADGRHGW